MQSYSRASRMSTPGVANAAGFPARSASVTPRAFVDGVARQLHSVPGQKHRDRMPFIRGRELGQPLAAKEIPPSFAQ